LPGSPAIDAGDPAAVAGSGGVPQFDQRGSGFGRVADGDGTGGARIDIGAFEVPTVVTPPGLPGDYNQDNIVDAADYVVWRKTLGTTVAPIYSGADGDGDGAIDQDDYGVWRAHFGQPAGAGSVASVEGPGDGVAAASAPSGASVSQPPALPGVALALIYANMPIGVGRSISVGERACVLPPAEPEADLRLSNDALVAWGESAGSGRGIRANELEAIGSDSTEHDEGELSFEALGVAVGELMSAALL
jgi:hypothetical protein